MSAGVGSAPPGPVRWRWPHTDSRRSPGETPSSPGYTAESHDRAGGPGDSWCCLGSCKWPTPPLDPPLSLSDRSYDSPGWTHLEIGRFHDIYMQSQWMEHVCSSLVKFWKHCFYMLMANNQKAHEPHHTIEQKILAIKKFWGKQLLYQHLG